MSAPAVLTGTSCADGDQLCWLGTSSRAAIFLASSLVPACSLRKVAAVPAARPDLVIPPLSVAARVGCQARLDQLTKPPGSLGRLESLAVDLAGMQDRVLPTCAQPTVLIAAADHGVARHGVSAYPPAVTAQMCAGFAAGLAAVNVLAVVAGARVICLDVGVDSPPLPGVVAAKVRRGTADVTTRPAMSASECAQAMAAGAAQVETCTGDVLVLGEMGIGNTTIAALLGCVFLGATVEQMVGPGTGIDAAGLVRKRAVITQALARHGQLSTAQDILATYGGLEIAALAGAAIAAAQRRIAVVVDGFISTAAALAAVRIAPGVRDYMIFSHRSAEPGHRIVLAALAAEPLLALELRLGEGSGGVLALPLLTSACALVSGMKTFAELGISGPVKP